MIHISQATCIRLKWAGFPQPEVRLWQIWYDEDGDPLVVVDTNERWPKDDGGVFQLVWMGVPGNGGSIFETNNDEMGDWCFAPSIEDITALLPPGWMLEIWDGRPSCSNRDYEQPIRTQHNTLVEAAALMWLAYNEDTQSANDWLDEVTSQK